MHEITNALISLNEHEKWRSEMTAWTFKEFKDWAGGAPVDLEELAESARLVMDNGKLVNLAIGFLTAKRLFEKFIEEAGIELG